MIEIIHSANAGRDYVALKAVDGQHALITHTGAPDGTATDMTQTRITGELAREIRRRRWVRIPDMDTLSHVLAQELFLHGKMAGAEAHLLADRLAETVQNIVRADTPAVPHRQVESVFPSWREDYGRGTSTQPVQMGSPWSQPFTEAATAKAQEQAADAQTDPWSPQYAREVLALPDAPLSWVERALAVLAADAEQSSPDPWAGGDYDGPSLLADAKAASSAEQPPLPEGAETTFAPGNHRAWWETAGKPVVTSWPDVEAHSAAVNARAKDAEPDDEGEKEDPEAKPEKAKKDKPSKEDKAFGKRMAVLRHVVAHLDGELPFPSGPKGPAWEFYVAAVRDVENFIRTGGYETFVFDPRGNTPGYGDGTPIDRLDDAQLLALAADLDVTRFNSAPRQYTGLVEALQAVVHDVYEDVWSTVAASLTSGQLRIGKKGRLVVGEWADENLEHYQPGH